MHQAAPCAQSVFSERPFISLRFVKLCCLPTSATHRSHLHHSAASESTKAYRRTFFSVKPFGRPSRAQLQREQIKALVWVTLTCVGTSPPVSTCWVFGYMTKVWKRQDWDDMAGGWGLGDGGLVDLSREECCPQCCYLKPRIQQTPATCLLSVTWNIITIVLCLTGSISFNKAVVWGWAHFSACLSSHGCWNKAHRKTVILKINLNRSC